MIMIAGKFWESEEEYRRAAMSPEEKDIVEIDECLGFMHTAIWDNFYLILELNKQVSALKKEIKELKK